jgi:selenocysteine-specific translation elongation factor
VQSKEFDRGYIISRKEEAASKFNLKCHLSKFTSPLGVGDAVHLFAGLQDTPATIGGIMIDRKDATQAPPGSDCNVVLVTQNNIAYSKNDRLLIAQLNAPKQRLVASAEVL